MDRSIDSSKLPEVLYNPAVPNTVTGKEPQNDIFHTFSLQNITRLDHDAEDVLYKNISRNSNLEQDLSTRNFNFQQYLTGKPILHSKELKTELLQIDPQLRNYQSPVGMTNFIISILIFCFILLAWLKYNFSKYLQQITHSVINYSESVKLHHDHNALVDRVYFVLNIIFVFSGGLLVYHFMNFTQAKIPGSNYFDYLLSCAFIIFIVSYRSILSKICGFVLKQSLVFEEYNHSNLLFFKASGIVLLPLTAFMSFISSGIHNYLLFIGLAILFLFFLVSIFRGTRIMLQKGVLLFYWILYLCTIEIIPLLLLLKYLNNSFIGL